MLFDVHVGTKATVDVFNHAACSLDAADDSVMYFLCSRKSGWANDGECPAGKLAIGIRVFRHTQPAVKQAERLFWQSHVSGSTPETKEQPVQESAAERAAVENVGETAEEVTEEGAVEEAVTKEDASGKAATEEEATEEAVSKEEAAEKAATEEEAAEKAATEEKTAEAAAENDKGSNEIHTKEDTEETIEIASEDEELTIESEAGNAAPFAHLEKEQSTRGFVYRLYKIVLGREPDADGLNYWVNELNSGRRKAA